MPIRSRLAADVSSLETLPATEFHLEVDPAALSQTDPAPELQPVEVRARRLGAAAVEAWLEQPFYKFRQAVRVTHKRRMRSNEVHYLDHPLLGIVIKVTPYEFEPFIIEPELAGSPR